MEHLADIAVIGLSVMGSSLALNIADHGYTVAVYNRTEAVTAAFTNSEAARGKSIVGCATLEDLVGKVKKPAPFILMIKAGQPVDDMIAKLEPFLKPGDIIIDAGNSFFRDTIRRGRDLAEKNLEFMGIGVSGGEEGARHGPSIMPGGSETSYQRVESILTAIAAKVNGESCCAYVGPDGAGHYVKMVHNGIEYADMQLIAEAYALLKDLAGLDYPAMRDIFAEWNKGELESYLIEITADILGRVDADTGKPICEIIMDKAGQKGTGRWTSIEALDLGIAAPTMIEAVQARSLSAIRAERLVAAGLLPRPNRRFDKDARLFAEAVRQALYASKLCCYAQGFQLIASASQTYGWNIDLGGLAMLWRGGCIIRAQFLERIRNAYRDKPDLANLLLDPYFLEVMQRSQDAWRQVIMTAAEHGIAVPAFASALSYYDGYGSARLPANLIQAQRDYFGAHTYERIDKEGVFHTEWQ